MLRRDLAELPTRLPDRGTIRFKRGVQRGKVTVNFGSKAFTDLYFGDGPGLVRLIGNDKSYAHAVTR